MNKAKARLLPGKAKLFPLLLLLLACFKSNGVLAQTPNLGIQQIIPNKLYVVYTGLDSFAWSSNSWVRITTSNIFLIKGMNDTLWIFGSGYGDKTSGTDSSDVQIYLQGSTSNKKDCSRNAINDAWDADTVITSPNYFGMNRSLTKIYFIVPHGHLDHVNVEFLRALFSLGYDSTQTRIWIHRNDYAYLGCTQRCCGTTPCPPSNWNTPFFGAPFKPLWTPYFMSITDTIGTASDAADQLIRRFTSACGYWDIKKDINPPSPGGHTRGAINLDNSVAGYRIMGGPVGPPTNLIKLPIHNNFSVVGTNDWCLQHHSCFEKEYARVTIYPNPFSDLATLTINPGLSGMQPLQNAELKIYDFLGREVKRSPVKDYKTQIERGYLPSGMYVYQLSSENEVIGTGKLVIE